MPTFELTTPDGRAFEVDAADIGMAQKAFDHAFGGGGGGAPEAPAEPPGQWELFKRGLSAIGQKPSLLLTDVGPVGGAVKTAREGGELIESGVKGTLDLADENTLLKAVGAGSLLLPTATTRLPGGVAPKPVSSIVDDALSSLSRPRAVEPTGGALAVQQAERLGVDLPAFVASDSRAVQALGQASRQLPIAGGIIEKAADRLTGQLGAAAERIATSQTEKAGLDKAELGSNLRGSLEKAVERIDETNHGAYAGFRQMIDPHKPVKDALAPIQDAFATILPERMAAGETGLGNLQPIANLLQKPGGPTFAGLQRARTTLTKAINYDSREGGFQAGDLKRMRTAVTEAMDIAAGKAAKADPEAARAAWRSADQTFAGHVEDLSSLSKALRNPSDEALLNHVLGMASEKSGNARRLVELHKQLGPETMQALGAHVLEQAGRAGEGWSPARFVTAMGKMSGTAKSLLYPQTRAQVDDLIGLASRWKEQEANFANRSNTGRAGLTGGAIGGALTAANPLLAIAKVAASVGGGVTIGMMLSRPVTAKAAVQLARAAERVATDPANKGAVNAYFALNRRLERLAAVEFGLSVTQPNQIPKQ